LHVKPHCLLLHASVALFGGWGHAKPQLPQLLRSFVRSSHVVGTPVAGHAVRPGLQLSVHPPPEHAAVPVAPFVGGAHAFVQLPQCAGSLPSS
jgi:hypothetical protein